MWQWVDLGQYHLEEGIDFLARIIKISMCLSVLDHMQLLISLWVWIKISMSFFQYSFPTHIGSGFKNVTFEILTQGHRCT